MLSYFDAPWRWSQGKERFAHIKCRQHKAHRIQSLEDVVYRELGAPYAVHLPDTGQIVLTPLAGGRGGCKPYGTNPLVEDRGESLAHPVTPSIEDEHAVPHSPSSPYGLRGLVGHNAAPRTAYCGGLRCHDK